MTALSKKKRRKNNTLKRWEVAIVKAMLERGGFGTDQDILAYFTRPTRSINHRLIGQIRREDVHARTKKATDEELNNFVASWPQIDPTSGLHIVGDERIIKAREAMLMAVQGYNNPKLYFRSEVFIVVSCIAWTYLLHAYFDTKGIDIRYEETDENGEKVYLTTKHGGYRYWDLNRCLIDPHCPLETGTKNNLNFLLKIRHEIEHQMTKSIDAKFSAKLQACCLNFNSAIKEYFGEAFGLDPELAFALQFSSLNPSQTETLLKEQEIPAHIEAARSTFENTLSEDEYSDPQYAYRVLYVPYIAKNKGHADEVIKFVKEGSNESDAIRQIALKETEKQKYRPQQVWQSMQAEGYMKFRQHEHTTLWRKLDAKNPRKGYGVDTSTDGWRWYETWIAAVRQHCEENREIYL